MASFDNVLSQLAAAANTIDRISASHVELVATIDELRGQALGAGFHDKVNEAMQLSERAATIRISLDECVDGMANLVTRTTHIMGRS